MRNAYLTFRFTDVWSDFRTSRHCDTVNGCTDMAWGRYKIQHRAEQDVILKMIILWRWSGLTESKTPLYIYALCSLCCSVYIKHIMHI